MILMLRGHIRNSFDTKNLYDLVKLIYNKYPDLKIYIHTWNIISNNISWRRINTDNRIVNEEIIYNYFDDMKDLIKGIIIDDDKKIEIIGNTKGNIRRSSMPLIGWKNYWYGKYKIIEHIKNNELDETEMVINCRFDVLQNSFSFCDVFIMKFLNTNSNIKFEKNKFVYEKEECGIDNFYIGNIKTMYNLISLFYYKLDEILSKDGNTVNQEKLVFRINETLC
jgi:hypothetical protein